MWGATWSSLEPWPGTYDFRDLDNQLQHIQASYYGCCGDTSSVTLINIQPINVTNRTVPWDLAGTSFDDPRMKARFRALIDALAPRLLSAPHVRYIMVGEEVNLYLALHPEEWQPYINFYTDAASYIRQRLPNASVGVPILFVNYDPATLQNLINLNAPSDVLALTYTSSPITGRSLDQQMRAPLTDFPMMVASPLASGRPLVLQEVSFPSTTSMASSEQMQAEWLSNTFSALASPQVNGSVAYINFLQLHDYAPATCDGLVQQFGLWFWPGASAYFCSLGFLRNDSSPKPAITNFAVGAAAINRIPIYGSSARATTLAGRTLPPAVSRMLASTATPTAR
jgi:hypothetical protein